MITIEKVNASPKDKVIAFLKNVPSIDNVDEVILNNAITALEDNKVVGCISYEIFDNKGLIRYFVFKKMLDTIHLENLLAALEQTAIADNLDMLVCIAESEQIEELFRSLGFVNVENNYIFINEEEISKTSFKNSSFLSKDLIN